LREVVENQALIEWAIDNQEIGRARDDRRAWFETVLRRFRTDRRELRRRQLMDRLRTAATDDERQRLLREIQDLDREPDQPGPGSS
jgi:hypothetical protein